MSKTVHCVRVASVLHHGGTFWEPDAWFPFQDRTPEWTSAPVQEVDRDFVPFRRKDPEPGAGGGELRLKFPFAAPIGRGNPLFDVWHDSLSPIEREALDGIGRRSPNEPLIVFDPVLAETALEKGTGKEAGEPLASGPLIAQLLAKFLDADFDNPRRVVFNKSLYYIRAVLGLTDSEWFAWELMQDGYTAAEIKRWAKPLSLKERSVFADQAGELGMKLGNQTVSTTLLHLGRKLADAREHFSGSPALRSKGPRYRNEFMLGLSAYRSTGRARTTALSDCGYTVRHSARTEIAAANAIRPQADGLTPAERFALGLSTYLATASRKQRGLYEPVIVFAASWTEPRDFRLVFQSVIDLDELFPQGDRDPGLLLRMLNDPDSMPSVLLNAA